MTLKLGYGQSTSNPRHITAVKYAKWFNEQTKGRVKIELYPEESLGNAKKMTEAAAIGIQDMVITAHGIMDEYEPKMKVIELPFLFSSWEKVGRILDGPIGEEFAKDLPKKGIRVLGYWENGLRQITNNKKPIEKPADLKGLKIRTAENKMSSDILTTLGAKPVEMPFPDVYLALSAGAIDGQENPVTNIESAKLYEVQKFISIINYKYDCVVLIISEKRWQKLPKDVQKVLKEGGIKFAKEHRKLVADNEEKLLKKLEDKGMKINRPDLKPFQDATKPVYTKLEKAIGKNLVDRVIKAAN